VSQRATQGRRTALVDPTVVLLQLAFYLVFGVSVWRYLRSRGPLELSVVAVFGGFVALFLLSFINGAAPALTPYVRWVLIALLYAQPYLVLRLVDLLRAFLHVFQRLLPELRRRFLEGARPPRAVRGGFLGRVIEDGKIALGDEIKVL